MKTFYRILIIILLIGIYVDQRLQIIELYKQAIEREKEIALSLSLARQYKSDLEANTELMEANNVRIKKALKSLGLGEHVKFYENKIDLTAR